MCAAESGSFRTVSASQSRLKAVCIDCGHPASLARWWADVLGWRVRPYTEEDLARLRDSGYEGPEHDPAVAVDPPGGAGPTLWFNRVPEPKTVKNRVHLDVYADVDDLQTKGASVVFGHGEQPDTDWAVLTDPEGNEFCVFRRDG
jgi:predicted enzyme related to lactoylglutathione lyase